MNLTTKTLGEICDEGGGEVRTGPFGSQLHQSDYSVSGIPVVMPKDIVEGKVSEESIARVSNEHVRRLSQHKLACGDIVYGRRGDIGRQALITSKEEGWICGTGCLRVSLGNAAVDPLFLHYYLRDESVIKDISNQAVGATMPNLNTTILRRICITYPPAVEQRRIASILSTYDDLIENNMRRIVILEEMARRIYEEWFVHFRFPGHENMRMVESELGPIPEGWGVVTLADSAHLTMGQSPKSEFYNTDGIGIPFHQGVTNFKKHFPMHQTYCTADGRKAEEGDILMSVRAPVGRINLATSCLVIGRGLCAIRSKSGKQWLLLHQLLEKFREEDSMGSGSIFKAVTKDDVQGIRFVTSPNELSEHFENVVGPIWNLIKNLTAKNTNLRTTRDFLLPKLITGEIDVSEINTVAVKAVAA